MKKEEKSNIGVIYLFLVAFAQIILTFEILSLVSSINQSCVLSANIILLIVSLVVWKKLGKKLYCPNILLEIQAINKALKRDKLLKILSFCFVIFLISQFLVAIFFPVTFGDAFSYYFPRCTAWIQQGNLNHFLTYDVRELNMPINMDILYTWYLMFFKSEQGIAIFPYLTYLGAVYVIYNFLGELGFCRRKRLWTVFVFSSFALIGVMSYTPSSDLLVGTLVLSAIYLFYIFLKRNDFIVLFFSSLAFAIAIGTKITAIFTLPALFFVFLFLTLRFRRKELKRITFLYSGLLCLNFLIFSSYNVILNLIEFSSPFSSESNFLMHQFRGGLNGYIYNLISYCFGIFDMSGLKGIDGYNKVVTDLLQKIYTTVGVSGEMYASKFYPYEMKFTSSMTTGTCIMGALGLFAFLPSLFVSIYKKIKYKFSEKSYILLLLVVAFFINILLFSRIMFFSTLNFRYFTAFIVIASPICVYSYFRKKNFYKIMLSFFMFIYLLLISTNKSIAFYLGYNNFKISHQEVLKPYETFISTAREEISIFNYFKDKKASKVAVVVKGQNFSIYDILKLRLYGLHLDMLLFENIEEYQLEQYDYIISSNRDLTSSKILRYDSDKVSPYTSCIYLNYEGNGIRKNSEERPVRVVCSLPYDYFKTQGFDVEKIFELKTITVLIWHRS